jgi:hypothetical protein
MMRFPAAGRFVDERSIEIHLENISVKAKKSGSRASDAISFFQ